MNESVTYVDYVNDREFMDDYADYQRRYANDIRESDRVLLDLVRPLVEGAARPLELVDVGCSTGNLLLHLKRAFPSLKLTGGEMPESILEANRKNPELEGIGFEYMDVVDLGIQERYDAAVVNAVFYLFDDETFHRALASLARALRPGGSLLTFDFFHSHPQELSILEKSKSHPEGLMLHFRPQDRTRRVMQEAGFSEVEFQPFAIPIDLEPGRDPADLISRTERTEDGRRLLFRGTLYQPWCHCVARKA